MMLDLWWLVLQMALASCIAVPQKIWIPDSVVMGAITQDACNLSHVVVLCAWSCSPLYDSFIGLEHLEWIVLSCHVFWSMFFFWYVWHAVLSFQNHLSLLHCAEPSLAPREASHNLKGASRIWVIFISWSVSAGFGPDHLVPTELIAFHTALSNRLHVLRSKKCFGSSLAFIFVLT